MKMRIVLAALGCALLPLSAPLSALADTRDDVLAGIQRCQSIKDDRAWLDCNYGAQQPMRAKLGLPPAPDFQQRLVPPVVLSPSPAASRDRPAPAPQTTRKPSLFQIITGNAAPVTVSTLAGVRYDDKENFVVTLENGEAWRQVDTGSGTRVRLTLGAKVTVKPGAMGSYDLKSDGTPRTYKVERLSKR